MAPEHDHGYTAVLRTPSTNWFVEWNGKMVGFVGCGGPGGGLPAVGQLRQVDVVPEIVPMRQQVALANVDAAFDQEERPAHASSTTVRS